ncbi:hypothetical protein [Ureibacillus sinduriensis]|uniref:Alpha-ribazole kinase n=1 Tax=Ureibacillus sinduriensis BLB-1 = JCM 15800 TaxID=1384057 RepID=A0A0A3HQ88_9BACL|nr:hypothetical protein [Ureibacillus sinduriensis]KGR74569.1 hypothetical protein CD33_15855 [Ureibacillus sinduriensis BLB-1 = JCM 15800]
MRNAIRIDDTSVVTIDNSSCIGEKELDEVHVSNELTAYYSMRVSLFEQWCAGAEPTNIFLSNFSGDEAWAGYCKGIQKAFDEIGVTMPAINGSSESNFQSLQSGISLMVIGKIKFEICTEQLQWFVIGRPLVGNEVITESHHVVKLKEIYDLIRLEIAKHVWPVGSKGILSELGRIFPNRNYECSVDLHKSSGPATSVIVGVPFNKIEEFKSHLTTECYSVRIY